MAGEAAKLDATARGLRAGPASWTPPRVSGAECFFDARTARRAAKLDALS